MWNVDDYNSKDGDNSLTSDCLFLDRSLHMSTHLRQS